MYTYQTQKIFFKKIQNNPYLSWIDDE